MTPLNEKSLLLWAELYAGGHIHWARGMPTTLGVVTMELAGGRIQVAAGGHAVVKVIRCDAAVPALRNPSMLGHLLRMAVAAGKFPAVWWAPTGERHWVGEAFAPEWGLYIGLVEPYVTVLGGDNNDIPTWLLLSAIRDATAGGTNGQQARPTRAIRP